LYLSGFFTEDDLWFIFPGAKNTNRSVFDVVEKLRLGFGNGDQRDGHISEPFVSVTHGHKHRGLAENAMDWFRVATFEQLAFILKYEVVQLFVTGHNRWRQEQMGLEHFPIPEKELRTPSFLI
jgi:hypothetical protein